MPTNPPPLRTTNYVMYVILFIAIVLILSTVYILGKTQTKAIPSTQNSNSQSFQSFTPTPEDLPVSIGPSPKIPVAAKPVIYLYPEAKANVTVKLSYRGKLLTTYPTYVQKISGWNVTAFPDGRLINRLDNKEYSYLFWEGTPEKFTPDLSHGFVVKSTDAKDFLQEKLSQLGLLPKEYNEFIVYWLPKLQDNKYNLITFVGKEYTDTAPLEITPKPDSMLRVFMVYKPLIAPAHVSEQNITPFVRKGFTVVEWGGQEMQ